jgi:hypothetical protein
MWKLKINEESGSDGVCPIKEPISNFFSWTLEYNFAFFPFICKFTISSAQKTHKEKNWNIIYPNTKGIIHHVNFYKDFVSAFVQ